MTYDGDRVTVDVTDSQTVGEVKQEVRDKFNMGPDPGPGGIGRERKILALHYMGADLVDDWIMYDVGIQAGSTIKVLMKDEIKPVLYLSCAYNEEIVPILDKFQVPTMKVCDLRSIATRKTGMPIGVFRMLSPDGKEMYDCNTLYDYQVELGETIRVETWDGWNDFLNLCLMGFTSHVFNQFSSDELLARYQMKVAMYLAAHYGHVDLAVSLLRQGVRADEVVGDHPSRQWCREEQLHIDALKTPVHVSSEQGQLGVLRSFVHNSVCNVLAKDGNSLTPLNIALRKKQKPCASFLLTKQWSKINYTTKTAIPLNIFVKMKRWSERAKDKVLIIHGQWKSSMKNPKRHIINGALVGHGVILDGFTSSKMTSKSKALVRQQEDEDARKKRHLYPEPNKGPGEVNPEQYFKSVNMMHSTRLPKLHKWNKMFKNVAEDKMKSNGYMDDGSDSDSESSVFAPDRREDNVKLPPIQENMFKVSQGLSSSHHNIASGSKAEPEFADGKIQRPASRGSFIQTGIQRDTANNSPLKQQVSQDDSKQPAATKKKKKKKDFDMLLAKARTADGGMPLPMVSQDAPRPFVKSSQEDITRKTLEHYERYRGLRSREYAIKCLSVANSFGEKPWLHQVRQAMAIAAQGVRKTVSRRSHLFSNAPDDEESENKVSESQSLLETQSMQGSLAVYD